MKRHHFAHPLPGLAVGHSHTWHQDIVRAILFSRFNDSIVILWQIAPLSIKGSTATLTAFSNREPLNLGRIESLLN